MIHLITYGDDKYINAKKEYIMKQNQQVGLIQFHFMVL